MRFIETALAGAFIVEPEPRIDDRGSFARTFCAAVLGDPSAGSAPKACTDPQALLLYGCSAGASTAGGGCTHFMNPIDIHGM